LTPKAPNTNAIGSSSRLIAKSAILGTMIFLVFRKTPTTKTTNKKIRTSNPNTNKNAIPIARESNARIVTKSMLYTGKPPLKEPFSALYFSDEKQSAGGKRSKKPREKQYLFKLPLPYI
jgi:hypothetical protein